MLRVMNEDNNLTYQQAISQPISEDRMRNNKDNSLSRQKRLESYQYGNDETLVTIIRKKPYNIRNKLERKWTAIDRILNPSLYEKFNNDSQHILNTDPDYKTSLTREQLLNIQKSPHRLSLALPYLSNIEEIRAHSLIKGIEFGRGISYFYSEDSRITLTKDDENLLNQRKKRVASLRAKLPEDRTEQENDWCLLDCILYPKLYSEKEVKESLTKYPSYNPENLTTVLYTPKNQLIAEEREMHEIYNIYNPDNVRNNRTKTNCQRTQLLYNLDLAPNILRQGMDCIIASENKQEIFYLAESLLLLKETRVHKFIIPNDIPYTQLEIKIFYKGITNENGYIPGRIGVTLFRELPDEINKVEIGYSNEEDVTLTNQNTVGYISIRHTPEALPLIPGVYEIVINSISRTKYSISAQVNIGEPLEYSIIKNSIKAKHCEQEMNKIKEEIAYIKRSIQLGEWKRKVCEDLLNESLEKAKQYEIDISESQEKLSHSKDYTQLDALEIARNISKLEAQFADEVSILHNRREEFNDIIISLDQMKSALNIRNKIYNEDKQKYCIWKDCIPDIYVLLNQNKSRTELINDLLSYQSIGSTWVAEILKKDLPNMASDAEKIRRTPLDQLSVDDRNWRLYDYVINPDNYPSTFIDPDAYKCGFTQDELIRLKKALPDDLLPNELYLHRLLNKYPDNNPSQNNQGNISTISRSKHACNRSLEEQEWIRLDRVLCPEYYGPGKCEKGDGLDERDLIGDIAPQGPFTLDELLRIKNAKIEDLFDENEVHAKYLLDKYSPEITKIEKSVDNNNIYNNDFNDYNNNVNEKIDVDKKCIELLEEIERVTPCKKEYIDSNVLEGVVQRYQTPILIKLLNEEIEKILRKEIEGRESSENNESRKRTFNFVDVPLTTIDIEEKENLQQQLEKSGITEKDMNNVKPDRRRSSTYEEFAKERLRKSIFRKDNTKYNESTICKACIDICKWKPYYDLEKVTKRCEELEHELVSIKQLPPTVTEIETYVPESVKKGGPHVLNRGDCVLEMQMELKSLERKKKITEVDKELHDVYNSNSPMITIKSIQGSEQTLFKDFAIMSLTICRDKLLAEECAYDTIDSILEWMYEGWHFGEVKSKYSVMGFVPSLSKNKIDVYHPLDSDKNINNNEDNSDNSSLLSKHETIFNKKKESNNKLLNQTERTLKFGIFSLVLEYFRVKVLLRKGEVANTGNKSVFSENKDSEERKEMNKEKYNLEKRLRSIREATNKSIIGQKKRERNISSLDTLQRDKLIKKSILRKKQESAVIKIQSFIRGILSRKITNAIKTLTIEQEAENNLRIAAAICIQRVYRGYKSRLEIKYEKIIVDSMNKRINDTKDKENDEVIDEKIEWYGNEVDVDNEYKEKWKEMIDNPNDNENNNENKEENNNNN